MGDVVLSTPIYHTLKQSFPDSFIGALVSSYTSPLLKGNPYIDVILTDERELNDKGNNFWQKVGEIRSHDFDTALLLMPTKRLAYMLFLAGIPYRVGVGHILYEVITLMHGVSRKKYNPLRHESDYMLDLVRKIVRENVPDNIWTKPEIFLADEEREAAREFLVRKGFAIDRPIIAVHPGSGHSSPNWEPPRYLHLAQKLAGEGIQILVTGDGREKDLERNFLSDKSENIRTSFGELSLREFIALISQMNLLISSSTGPMHIASAVGTPTVSMFCPLSACSPKLWGPIGNDARIVLPPDDFCQKRCPGDPHVCTFGSGTEGITIKTVFDSTIEMLNKTEAAYPKDPLNDNSAGNRQRR